MSRTERQAGYRHELRRTVGSAAVPYRYTLSIWGGGGAAIHRFGPPSLIDALLVPAGVSVLLAAAATELLSDTLAWPAAGFLVTVAYLILSALQAALASREA